MLPGKHLSALPKSQPKQRFFNSEVSDNDLLHEKDITLYHLYYLLIYGSHIQAKATKTTSWFPRVREDRKFVINSDSSADSFLECHVFLGFGQSIYRSA
jgi:hypothetical protein